MTNSSTRRNSSERNPGFPGPQDPALPAIPSGEDVLRSMHEATQRARTEAIHWLIFRDRMARAVAEFREVAAPQMPGPDDEGGGTR